MSIIVLKLQGKDPNDKADYVSVHMFSTQSDAERYCKDVTTEKKKNWVKADIVSERYPVEPYYADL